ncbi:MAG: response regulator [Candidatus Scalindua sp.]|jgi:CheY-like chemotaxis protein|nr:response regulator [Candidatus Scalindua sp.]MBT5307467.1 response regulator [Candidatus Scalindua sp.]MBT6052977.1 response regulator [Candidatus Scalindua sp.]MBT6562320.1 response regulator [Candidatus Scalindua sp.]MBT7212253.1 response regulator [Candidatus Scalindua sp.]
MSTMGRILLADDEEFFLSTTSDLLVDEGYECVQSQDAESALIKLKSSAFDLLIADIHMPGNSELELVKEMHKIAEGMPVILITGNPSVETATKSIQLPVVAYMAKPFDADMLFMHVKDAISNYKTYCSVQNSSRRLQEWQKDLDSIKKLVSNTLDSTSSIPIHAFFKLTFRNITESLLDLDHLIEGLNSNSNEQYACNLLDCPSLTKMKGGLIETMEVLRKTRESFKSKDLARLRDKLDTIVKDVR